MKISPIWVVLLAWLPLVLILFRVIGPRRAALVAVFGGFLFLPRDTDLSRVFDTLSVTKRVVSGLGLLLGLLIFDARRLFRGRPRLVDLPMFAFVLLPLISLAANKFQDYPNSIDQVWRNCLEWAMPYLVGRLYFGDREAPRDLSIAIVVAGLASVPICVFEIVMGSKYYLMGLLYGIRPHEHMVSRLGGWRPEGFLTNGIELSTWMALASTTAAWIWLRRGWIPWRFPSWSPALTLTVVTVACRGVYGYACLAIGLASVGLSQLLRTRFLIASLMLLPPAYITVRASGLWDGRQLIELAGKIGKGDSVAYRLRAEDSYLRKVFDHGPLFGFGGTNYAIFDWFAQGHLWADGWWIHQLQTGGLVGVAVFLLAFFLVPSSLGLALAAGRSGRASPGALAWGLALFVILHMFDSLQNMAYLPQTTLIGGSLTSVFLARRTIRPDVPPLSWEPVREGPTKASLTPLLISVVILTLVEILGSLPKTPSLPTAPNPAINPSPTNPEPSAPRLAK